MRLLTRGWRRELETLFDSARDRVTTTAPFIKEREAEWIRGSLDPAIRLAVLTDINVRSVRDEALDVEALVTLAERARSTVTTLPRLHAKVFVADDSEAIITSGNLTTAGLDHNYEYGLLIDEPAVVTRVEADLAAYARVGAPVTVDDLHQLATIGRQLRAERREAERTIPLSARRAFAAATRRADHAFLSAQVGFRSANALFGHAITYALRDRALRTPDLHREVKQLQPELCDDSRELVIKGQRFGKAWKHSVRNAQQQLSRRGLIALDPVSRKWSLRE